MSALSHLDADGRARMIDVGGKAITRRVAVAEGRLRTTPDVVALVAADGLRKADALATARVAGIQAAKRTSELIPLAHLLPLESVVVDLDPDDSSIGIRATVATTAKTGVEMEALTAVAVAGLTLHDMIKALDPGCVLDGIRLIEKTGGTHGDWTPDTVSDPPHRGAAVVVVSSTSVAAGTREDRTGPLIVDWLSARGYLVDAAVVVADADLPQALGAALAGSPALVITTGGTGIHPEDRTPEATRSLLDLELPGIADAIRTAGRAATPTAALSRALAGIAGSTIVVNLPGAPEAVRDGLAVLDPLLPHVHDQIVGGDHGPAGHE